MLDVISKLCQDISMVSGYGLASCLSLSFAWSCSPRKASSPWLPLRVAFSVVRATFIFQGSARRVITTCTNVCLNCGLARFSPSMSSKLAIRLLLRESSWPRASAWLRIVMKQSSTFARPGRPSLHRAAAPISARMIRSYLARTFYCKWGCAASLAYRD